MARCDEGYRCDVCGVDVEEMVDSDLYLRYILGEVSPDLLPRMRERHIRCNPGTAQYIVDAAFAPAHCEGIFARDQLDPGYVAEQEERVTRAWRRLQQIPSLGIPITEYPLPEVLQAWQKSIGNKGNEGEKKVDTRVFEMRTYYAASGKMKALHARFRDHTCKLFKKHGMTIVGFWSPADPREAEKTLVYILAYSSREAATRSWKAFQADPDWQSAKTASEEDGKLVDKVESVFLNGTDYSPIK